MHLNIHTYKHTYTEKKYTETNVPNARDQVKKVRKHSKSEHRGPHISQVLFAGLKERFGYVNERNTINSSFHFETL